MGFSLSRAMQGAAMGAAHAAGEIFDGMIAEERKTRELDAAMQRQMQAQEQMDVRRDELAAAREASRDATKEALGKRKQQEVTDRMGAYYAAAREKGLDPNKLEGLRHIANSALEKGDIGVYDKITDNIDKREKNLSDAENRKLQISALHESRAARKRGESEASNNAALARIEKYASTFAIPGERDENGEVIKDKDEEAVAAARDFAQQELATGASEKSVLSQLAQLRKQFGVIRATDKYKTLSSTDQFEAAINPRAFDEGREKAKGKSAPSPATTTAPIGTRAPDNGGGVGGWISRKLSELPPLFTDEHL